MRSATARGVFAMVAAAGAACGGEGGATDAASIDAVSIDAPPPDARGDAYNPSCAGDGVGQGNGGFVRPTLVSRAWQETAPGMWTEVGPADWSCRPLRLSAPRPAGSITGVVRDFLTNEALPNALVEAFVDGDLATPDAMTTSTANGSFALAVPVATDLALRVDAGPEYVTTIHLAPDPTLTDPQVLSNSTVAALPALVGITHMGGPIVMGAVEDCAGYRVSDVVVTASVEDDCVAHGLGARTFYFGNNGLPTRNNIQPVATENGEYMVLLDAATTGQVQVWGFDAGDDPATSPLRLLETRSAALAPGTATIIGAPLARVP